ncbi:flagellar hook-basal body protein [Stenotrophomonas maltophilia]|uniref:Flagellar hook-basal body complex protein FliE n=1 Tax=Stenotrophomonas maltophilia TaxID=40324 RepID=A0A0F5ZPQ1_STEMA|nr:flagellar hook-basal body protein [Stenotrophomonas maltophilia]
MSHSVTSILSQIRSYQTQMGQPALNPLGETPRSNALPGTVLDAPQAQPASFTEPCVVRLPASTMRNRIRRPRQGLRMGDPSADLAKVMVASQQSQIAFRATVEVRNRLVQAYQDVMNMPL